MIRSQPVTCTIRYSPEKSKEIIMDSNPTRLIVVIRDIQDKYNLSWAHRAALAWVVAKLMIEESINE